MAKKITQNLTKKLWSQSSYYAHAAAASKTNHPGLKEISKFAKKAKTVLEVGCGEGSKLAQIAKTSQAFGVDVSEEAIKIASKKYPKLKFLVGDVTKLPFKTNFFDLTFSAFALEHTEVPEKAILEQIRVTKINGKLAFIAPNFGAPNRASPCFVANRLLKLFVGVLKDFFYLFTKLKNLNWLKVQPRLSEPYQIDFDSISEPYLLTLKMFLEQRRIKIIQMNSFWQMELKKARVIQKIFRFLGEKLKIYPFSFWGPHLFLVGVKL